MRGISIRPMDYYVDRANVQKCIEIADNLLENRIYLWGNIYLTPSTENMFDSVFVTSEVTNRVYLFSMDYLSALLSAYQKTNDMQYRKKFMDVINQFFVYYDRSIFFLSPEDDLIPCGQTLMFIKSFSIIGYEEPLKSKVIDLLYHHAEYCFDDRNHWDHNNHGLFTDMALLHLSVLFETLPEAQHWRKHAVERVQQLFKNCFYADGWNNEGSLTYFWHNLVQYQHIITFCEAYQITGLETMCQKMEHFKQTVFRTFAHSDDSFPIIGDGAEFMSTVGHNDTSMLCPDAGICAAKIGEMYLTFKAKTPMQPHAHVDDSSITARFRSFDLALDSGQYDYDRYHPINRFQRTSGGHSGIFPLFVDGLSLKEYLGRRSWSGIDCFNHDGTTYHISGGYELDNGAIKVRRDIKVEPERIEVQDRWSCTSSQTMRQRFVLPKEFLDTSRFTASKRLFETTVRETQIRYEIISGKTSIVTAMNFGVCSKHYLEYEPTILLDTVAENSLRGSITAVISVQQKKGE